MDKERYELFFRIGRIGNRAIQKAREANRQAGLPNVGSRNGRLYWEMSDGTITMENPFASKEEGK